MSLLAIQQEYAKLVPRLIDKAQMRSIVGADCYVGGLVDMGSGHLHPLNYTLGLGRAALAAGTVIHEQTQVLSVKPAAQAG